MVFYNASLDQTWDAQVFHTNSSHVPQRQFFFFVFFFCVEVLRPSQPNGVMLSVVSLHNHTFTGQA